MKVGTNNKTIKSEKNRHLKTHQKVRNTAKMGWIYTFGGFEVHI